MGELPEGDLTGMMCGIVGGICGCQVAACKICEYGLKNPDFVPDTDDDSSTTCASGVAMIESIYSAIGLTCDEAKGEVASVGCECIESSDESATLDSEFLDSDVKDSDESKQSLDSDVPDSDGSDDLISH